MAIYRPDPMDRLDVEYDMERLEFIWMARVPKLPPVEVAFVGGPLDGRRRTFATIPDEMWVHGEDGRYVPHITEPTYYWMPVRD